MAVSLDPNVSHAPAAAPASTPAPPAAPAAPAPRARADSFGPPSTRAAAPVNAAEPQGGPAIDTAISAARAGDVGALRSFLEAGGNPNQYDREGWTPLLAAASRGQADATRLLLDNPNTRADPAMPHRDSGALPIHMAGHSGNVDVAKAILDKRPDQLDQVWDLNGHTLLLQAAFYGHTDLARFAVERGANTAATTVRGLGAREMALQFNNQATADAIAPRDSSAEQKAAYTQQLLQRIAPPVPATPEERATQALSDRLVDTVQSGLRQAATDPAAAQRTMDAVRDLVEHQHADVNRLGGPLTQPPLVVAVTGNNGTPPNEAVAKLRSDVANYLMDHGANPTVREVHPMAVDAVIRASVFNHLPILEDMGRHLTRSQLAEALNSQPMANGMTALHDTVLRASTAPPDRIDGYLAQIQWAVSSGARSDIEDFSGRTQESIARSTQDPAQRARILEALGLQ